MDQTRTWWPLVNNIVSRTRSRIWALVRLRDNGATIPQLVTTYQLRIRTLLEYACPVWLGMLNGLQKRNLEAVQRQALVIILGKESQSYEKNLIRLGLVTLEERWLLLTKRFAVHTLLYINRCFTLNPRYGDKSRVNQKRLLLPKMSNLRGEGAPFNFMSRLINQLSDKEFSMLAKGAPMPRPPSDPG